MQEALAGITFSKPNVYHLARNVHTTSKQEPDWFIIWKL
jgi:hypothetical protein